MTERLLQYIWQFQQYNHSQLTTLESELLQVSHPGSFNTNQGPDFLDAKIRINNTTWAGSIELHLLSSHWKVHGHSNDHHYNNVILHVVWVHDTELHLPFSTLELQHRVPKWLLQQYQALMQNPGFIPCENRIQTIQELIWVSWKTRLLVERMMDKTAHIVTWLQENKFHWEATLWWLMARNFGAVVNSDAFEQIARSIPLSILSKHKHQINQVEALLFGQAGLLQGNFEEHYPIMLQKEYRFLMKKYSLQKPKVNIKMLRMRPSNFPTVRLAQLAMLVHQSAHLFSKFIDLSDLQEVKQLLEVTANDYWHVHYVFDNPAKFNEKKLGSQMINHILINTLVPICFAYGDHQQNSQLKEKAMHWLQQLPAEKNSICRGYELLGIANHSAFDSQALLQLNQQYCQKKRCLDCSIGNKLLSAQ